MLDRSALTKRLSFVAGLLLALVCLGAVLTIAEPGEVLARMGAMTPGLAVLALTVFSLIHAVMALRILRSLGTFSRTSLAAALLLSVRHAFLLAVLPARMGDVAYPVMLARALRVPLGVAMGNLLVLRIMDVVIIVAIMGLTAPLVTMDQLDQQLVRSMLWALAGLFALCGAGLVFMSAFLRVLMRLWLRFLGRRLGIAGVLRTAARWARALTPARRLEIMLWTLLRWLLAGGVLYVLFAAVDAPVSSAEALFLAAGLNLVAIIPAQSFGGLGLMEGSLMVLLMVLGRAAPEAAAVGLSVRLSWLLLPIIIGLFGEIVSRSSFWWNSSVGGRDG